MTWVAVAIGGAGAIGAAGSIIGVGKQASAAEHSADVQQNMFNQVQQKQQPFWESGVNAQHQLNYLLGTGTPGQDASKQSNAGGYGSLVTPFTAANWQQLSPGYGFQKQQGTQGVLNADAGSQGSLSGASLKDLMGFNQGLANTSFNNAFNMYQTQQGNIFSRLTAIANQGQAAGSNTATGASNFGSSIGNQISNAGAASGGGVVGAANAGAGSLSALAFLNQGGTQQVGNYGLGYDPSGDLPSVAASNAAQSPF